MNKRSVKRISNRSSIQELQEQYLNEKEAEGVTKSGLDTITFVFSIFNRDNGIDGDSIEICTKDFMHKWIIFMQNETGIRPATINTYIGRMRSFLYWCMREGYLHNYTISCIKHQEEELKYYTDDELEALLKKPKANCGFREYRSWVICSFIMATGARAGTIREILIDDLDLKTGTVVYRHLKNKKAAIIPLTSDMCRILQEYVKVWCTGSEYLFCDVNGGQLTTNAIRQAMDKYCKERGVKSIGVHALRHSFARAWIMNGGGAPQLSKMLTHSDLQMTNRYIRLFGEDLRDDVEKYSPLASFQIHRVKRV